MTNKELGRRLYLVRKKLKITQEAMGKVLKIHQTAVCRVEAGKQELSALQLTWLDRAYRERGYDSIQLLFWNDKQFEGDWGAA